MTSALRMPVDRTLADYLRDPDNRFAYERCDTPASTTGTVTLGSCVRFTRRLPSGRGKLCVDVHADGSVVLTRFGRVWWRVTFESPGNRISVAPVPAAVILAAVRAAVDTYTDREGVKVCGAYYGKGGGEAAHCVRPEGHPEVAEDRIGHSDTVRT